MSAERRTDPSFEPQPEAAPLRRWRIHIKLARPAANGRSNSGPDSGFIQPSLSPAAYVSAAQIR
jgi:hypothetical protein